jgi:DNA-binding MarR family transcriptional regulator
MVPRGKPASARAKPAATGTRARTLRGPAAAKPPSPTPPDSAEPAARVLRQFRQIFNSVKTHLQQMERRAGVGGVQVWALSIVRDRPGIGVNDVARALDVRQPTASNLIKSLVRQSCIDLRKEGSDRRAVQLYITPIGARVLRHSPGPFNGVLPEALAGLPPATLQRLEQDLAVLIESLRADEGAGRIPLGEL